MYKYCVLSRHRPKGKAKKEGGKVNTIDTQKTRRRIEDALRKTADEDTLVRVAKSLGVEVVYLPQFGEIPKLEKQLADLLEGPFDKKLDTACHNILAEMLPLRFTVYFICIHTGKGGWNRTTRDFFTKEAAEAHIPGVNYFVNTQPLNILGIRLVIRDVEEKAAAKDAQLTPEEIEVIKQLKPAIY